MTRTWYYFKKTSKTDVNQLKKLTQLESAMIGTECVGCTVESTRKALFNRPGIQAIMDAATQRSFDILLCSSLDTLSKNQAELKPFLEFLKNNNIYFGIRNGAELL